MSEFEEGSPPDWFQDISNAFASSRQTTPERRLQALCPDMTATVAIEVFVLKGFERF